MKYRIVKQVIGTSTTFVPQRKPWWSPVWIKIKSFYRSDFEDMPGWWSSDHNSTEDANRALLAYEWRQLEITEQVVHRWHP